MNRALAALALGAGLFGAGAVSAQGYPQPYPSQQPYGGQSAYGQPSYGGAQPGEEQGRGDDRYDRERDRDQRGGDPRDQQQPSGYGDQRDYEPRRNTTPIYPDRENGDPRYQADGRSIDPAPGARGPYVGAGPGRFYNVEDRIGRVESRMAALPAAQRRRAYAEMRSIRAEEGTQRAKHGDDLRDWDREHLTRRLDALVRRYPGLGR